MKRNDDNTGGIIKIPDVSAVTASVAQQQLQQSVFVQRQPTTHIEMSSRPSVTSVGGSQISLPRAHPGGPAPGTTGVTVYRSDGGAVSNPPAAHSGGIAVTTTPSSVASSQQPPAAHIGGPSGMNQPPTNLKAEQISKSIVQKFREIVMGKELRSINPKKSKWHKFGGIGVNCRWFSPQMKVFDPGKSKKLKSWDPSQFAS